MSSVNDSDVNVAFTEADVREAVRILAAANPLERLRLAVDEKEREPWDNRIAREWFRSLCEVYPLATSEWIVSAAHAATCKQPGIALAHLAKELQAPHVIASMMAAEETNR